MQSARSLISANVKLSSRTSSLDACLDNTALKEPISLNHGQVFVPFSNRAMSESIFNVKECKKRKISGCLLTHEGLSAINYGLYCPSLFVPIEDGDSTIDSLDANFSNKSTDDDQRQAVGGKNTHSSSPEPRFIMNVWSIDGPPETAADIAEQQ